MNRFALRFWPWEEYSTCHILPVFKVCFDDLPWARVSVTVGWLFWCVSAKVVEE